VRDAAVSVDITVDTDAPDLCYDQSNVDGLLQSLSVIVGIPGSNYLFIPKASNEAFT
jgi:hypothetical protein